MKRLISLLLVYVSVVFFVLCVCLSVSNALSSEEEFAYKAKDVSSIPPEFDSYYDWSDPRHNRLHRNF